MRKINAITALSCLILATSAWTQARQTTAQYVAPRTISVDGRLGESVWNNVNWQNLLPSGMQIVYGSADDKYDLSGSFAVLWDSTGLCVGTKYYDDIHNAPWSAQPGVAHHAWKDDGMQWWIDFDFNDVWEDASPLYFGQYGWMVWKGFSWKSGQSIDKYVSYRNDNGPVTTTVADLKQQGFEAPYFSYDGINFQCETRFRWSSFMLGSMSTPGAGKELGFNVAVNDNDGGDMLACMLSWTGGTHNNYQGWGKITLAGPTQPSDNLPPIIGHTHSYPYVARLGQQVTLRGHASDPNGDPLKYTWIIPKYGKRSGWETYFPAKITGEFPVVLEVRDPYGGMAVDSSRSFRVTRSQIAKHHVLFDSAANGYSACKTLLDTLTHTQIKARIYPKGKSYVYFWQEPKSEIPAKPGWKLVKTVTMDFSPDFSPRFMLSKYEFFYEQEATVGITEERFLRMFVLQNGKWKGISAGLNILRNSVTVYGDNQVNSDIRLGATFAIFGPIDSTGLPQVPGRAYALKCDSLTSGGLFAGNTVLDSATNTEVKVRATRICSGQVGFWNNKPYYPNPGWKMLESVSLAFSPGVAPYLMLTKFQFSYSEAALQGTTGEKYLRMFVLEGKKWKGISASLNIGTNTLTVYGDNVVNAGIRTGGTFGIFGRIDTTTTPPDSVRYIGITCYKKDSTGLYSNFPIKDPGSGSKVTLWTKSFYKGYARFWENPQAARTPIKGRKLLSTVSIAFTPSANLSVVKSEFLLPYRDHWLQGNISEKGLEVYALSNGRWVPVLAKLDSRRHVMVVECNAKKNAQFRYGGTFAIFGKIGSLIVSTRPIKPQAFDLALPQPGSPQGFLVSLEKPCNFSLNVYDALGRNLFSHSRQNAAAGFYQINWNTPSSLDARGNGVCFVSLRRGDRRIMKKMLMFK